jgi:hypothetical protein
MILPSCNSNSSAKIRFTKPVDGFANKRIPEGNSNIKLVKKEDTIEKNNNHLDPETISYYRRMGSDN